MRFPSNQRKALSLVELVVFIAIFSVLITSVLPLMSMAIDHYFQQKNMALVENNAVLALNELAKNIRTGERILEPLQGQTGSVLALQTGWGFPGPLVIGVNYDGLITTFAGDNRTAITSSDVDVENLVFRNTSNDSQQNIDVSFSLSVTSGTPPRTFRKRYQMAVNLYDIPHPQGNICGCNVPTCVRQNVFVWQLCTVQYGSTGALMACPTSTGSILCYPHE